MSGRLYDTHVHTSEVSPCGQVPAGEMVNLYKRAGYSGIVITDHFHSYFFDQYPALSWDAKVDRYLAGFRAARRAGEKLGLTVLWGLELRFPGSNNDYLVFGVDEAFLLGHENLHELGLNQFRKLTQGQNIRIYQAHPFRDFMTRAEPDLLDGVEVFNGHPGHNSRNHLAKAFAREHSLPMIAGSDAHAIHHVATAGIVSHRPIKSMAQFVALLDSQEFEFSNAGKRVSDD